jgi:peptide/nickel transport system substrate-binding protein
MKLRSALLGAAALTLLATAPALAQKSKDTVRIPMLQPISGVDSYLDPGPEPDFRRAAVYDNLIGFDEDNAKYIGRLAKSWKQVDDRTIEFDLHDDVKWHDGEPFTADDVVYTFNWGMDDKVVLRNKRDFAWIEKVEKISNSKVRLTAKHPAADGESILSMQIYMLPKHLHSKYPPNETLPFSFKPVGTGPFVATEVDKNKGVFLKKNDAYKHGNAAGPAAGVTYQQHLFMPDLDVQIAQFLAGNLDVLVRITVDQMDALAKQMPGVGTQLVQGGSVSYLALDAPGHSKNKVFQDIRVRKAMFMAIDPKELTILEAGNHDLDRGVPPAMCYKDQMGCDYSVEAPKFDPAGAKKLLAEAGYPNGFEVRIGTYTSAVQNHAVAVANMLNKIGVKSAIDKFTINNFRDAMRKGEIEAFVGGFPIASQPDINNTVANFFDVPDTFDHAGDDQLKKWAKEMPSIMDPVKRKALGRQMFDRATEQAFFIPIGPRPQSVVTAPGLDIKLSRYNVVGLTPGYIRWK